MENRPVLRARTYRAFISYRHADNRERDRQWATWLHRMLETYSVPKSLAGTTNDRGEEIPRTLYPVFRDEEELPADSDLSEPIRRALERSVFLIVVCSPGARESRFVAEEIRYFKELGREDRILALIIKGEPNASDGSKGDPAQECFPEPLRFGVRTAKGVDWTQLTEPIAADVRPGGLPEEGYTTAKAYAEALKAGGAERREAREKTLAYTHQLQLAKLKIVAGMLGVPLGELTKRDAAHRASRRRRQALVAGVFLALLFFAAVAVVWQSLVARRNFGESVDRQAMMEMRSGCEMLADGDVRGLAFLAKSLRTSPEGSPALIPLLTRLCLQGWPTPLAISKPFPLSLVGNSDPICAIQAEADGSFLIGSEGSEDDPLLDDSVFRWKYIFRPEAESVERLNPPRVVPQPAGSDGRGPWPAPLAADSENVLASFPQSWAVLRKELIHRVEINYRPLYGPMAYTGPTPATMEPPAEFRFAFDPGRGRVAILVPDPEGFRVSVYALPDLERLRADLNPRDIPRMANWEYGKLSKGTLTPEETKLLADWPHRWDAALQKHKKAAGREVRALSLSPSGQSLFVATTDPLTFFVVGIDPESLVAVREIGKFDGVAGGFESVFWARDENGIALLNDVEGDDIFWGGEDWGSIGKFPFQDRLSQPSDVVTTYSGPWIIYHDGGTAYVVDGLTAGHHAAYSIFSDKLSLGKYSHMEPTLAWADDRDVWTPIMDEVTFPRWLPDLAEALCGWKVNEAGVLEPYPRAAELYRQTMQTIEQSSEPLAKWVRRYVLP